MSTAWEKKILMTTAQMNRFFIVVLICMSLISDEGNDVDVVFPFWPRGPLI